MAEIKKIAVYTSGGDSPGMNAAIRSVVRSGIHQKLEVVGVLAGYNGMLKSDFIDLNLRSVANSIQRGGTILKTARCLDFHQVEVRKQAAKNLKNRGIDALVCIGGDGSLAGAQALYQEHKIPVIGLPGTIDNDIYGSDTSIGYDTALNTAVEAIDKIRDTASSHDRIFIVEVMGRNSGHLALDVGLAAGAESIFIPEVPFQLESVSARLKASIDKGKLYSIMVTAEGQKPGRAYDLADSIRKKSAYDAKVCILGHIQRGGSPSARDRIIAGGLAAAAVEALLKGQSNLMAGLIHNQLHFTSLDDVINKQKNVREDKLQLANILAM